MLTRYGSAPSRPRLYLPSPAITGYPASAAKVNRSNDSEPAPILQPIYTPDATRVSYPIVERETDLATERRMDRTLGSASGEVA